MTDVIGTRGGGGPLAGRSALTDLQQLALRAAAGRIDGMQDEMRMAAGARGESPGLPQLPVPPQLPALRAARQAAVLVLFGARDGLPHTDPAALAPEDCDVLLVERAATLDDHPGQIAFPGGGLDEDDDGMVAAAVREAVEETGLEASGVQVLGQLPLTELAVSNFAVTPVLAWWAEPSPVYAVDPGESARVFRAPVRELLDPANRLVSTVRRGSATFRSPTFLVQDAVVWGFTGGILSRLFEELGWARDWDMSREMPAPL
ncbi:NUDIX hydrolase [Psychromicrobium xiongbiense]|uniref:NUDIX hydrolase n=1 Tax=Psychromicrobium xiongbiense TaxID=3051184 RepID=UPI00255304C5|nr:CoA pyrophosphatase [Psychromicrobium sp. YIM S02556]